MASTWWHCQPQEHSVTSLVRKGLGYPRLPDENPKRMTKSRMWAKMKGHKFITDERGHRKQILENIRKLSMVTLMVKASTDIYAAG